MKRTTLLITFVMLMVAGFTQKAAVVSAYNYHKDGKLDKAKEYIDKAITHEKTMNDAKTWFYRGNIYIDIYRSTNDEYRNLDPDALNKAYEAYVRAKELDDKDQYTNDINNFMPIVGEAYFNDGANRFNDGMGALDVQDSAAARNAFMGAVKSFEKAYDIYKEAGTNDTTTIYYISVSAELGQDYDKARSTLEQLVEMNYPKSSIYSSLAGINYNQDKDVEKALKVYEMGRERFPDDLNLLLNQTNMFLAEEMTEEALNNLEKAAEMDTTNATIFFAIGAKYNEIADDKSKSGEVREDAFLKAVNAYERSIAIRADYFDPIYNMGALYVNKAAVVIDSANNLPIDKQKEYEVLKSLADDYLKKSLPYLEKAHEMEPNDMATMASLKEIYIRLDMMDKKNEIEAEMDGM
ncbi:MAG: hypothetical protein KQI35_02185 [Bacteroidetes bacterium]|nr:hypothetical protein [Bacteroidota bacterium]